MFLNKIVNTNENNTLINEKDLQKFLAAPLEFEKEVISKRTENYQNTFIDQASQLIIEKLKYDDEYFYSSRADNNYSVVFNNVFWKMRYPKNFLETVQALPARENHKNSLLRSTTYHKILTNIHATIVKNPLFILKIKNSSDHTSLIL